MPAIFKQAKTKGRRKQFPYKQDLKQKTYDELQELKENKI
jgi:hypothetical protein